MSHVPHTRQRLVLTAAQLLWERTYFSTGVAELCAKSGARKGSFYHFFPSKIDLALAALEHGWLQLREEVFEPVAAAQPRGLDRLRAFAERVGEIQARSLATTGQVLGCPFGNLGQETSNNEERLRQGVQALFDRHCDYFESWLQEAEGDGQILPGDNRRRARLVLGLYEGALLLSKVARDPAVFDAMVDPMTFLAASPDPPPIQSAPAMP